MNWKKLVDRCELVCDSDRGLLKSLLFEAEEELCREVDLYEDSAGWIITTNTALIYGTNTTYNSFVYLPGSDNENFLLDASSKKDMTQFSYFKKEISVSFDGQKLKPVFEADFNYKSDGQLYDGTPVGYAIHNDRLRFTHNVPAKFLLINYYGVPRIKGVMPSIPEIYHKDLVYYACHIATMKSNPNASASFLNLWNIAIEKIKNQEGDREMINSVREVI